MLTCEVGNWKTLMSRSLNDNLPKAQRAIGLVVHPSCSWEKFLGEIPSQFGLSATGTELKHPLESFLGGVDTILIVDEARTIVARGDSLA